MHTWDDKDMQGDSDPSRNLVLNRGCRSWKSLIGIGSCNSLNGHLR